MSQRARRRAGFSLIELMIICAIIAILVEIAIPNFIAMRYKARRAEIWANLDGIITAQLAYDATYDAFLEQTVFSPEGCPSTSRVFPRGTAFDTLGFRPDGKVWGAYATGYSASCGLWAQAQIDLDRDGEVLVMTRFSGNRTELARSPSCLTEAVPPMGGGDDCATGLEIVTEGEET